MQNTWIQGKETSGESNLNHTLSYIVPSDQDVKSP